MPHGKMTTMTTDNQAVSAPDMMPAIAANITDARARMSEARPSPDTPLPALVAVSKRQPDDRIEAALLPVTGCLEKTVSRKHSNGGSTGASPIQI